MTLNEFVVCLFRLQGKTGKLRTRSEKWQRTEQRSKRSAGQISGSSRTNRRCQRTSRTAEENSNRSLSCATDVLGHRSIGFVRFQSIKNQKRLFKQTLEEKRFQTSQRLTEYAQVRYLLDHRPQVMSSGYDTQTVERTNDFVRCLVSVADRR
jgi:hypothetical protein